MNFDDVIARYLAAWNERDPQRRRAAVDDLWTEDGTYTDPLAAAAGRDAIDATISAVQGKFPDFTFRPGPTADSHHNIGRFTWELGPEGGAAVVVGFDVAVLDESGRIKDVLGFLDKIPG
ncbi:nuclear transport factor 2 family protein [Saccharopolyspora taberi]|uniref:Nuclear transport factor 2 family protein n=1 Tax=Saccharopolyspora taberi TaxID=60895 RepID=A0ABN3VL97_9PSEU